ncbi:hypothetical protein NEH69_10600, partial [Turicibacter sp. TA25]
DDEDVQRQRFGQTDALGQRHEGNEGNVSRSLMFENKSRLKRFSDGFLSVTMSAHHFKTG